MTDITIPRDLALKALDMLETAARQLARTGGMLNRDVAHEVTAVASQLRAVTTARG